MGTAAADQIAELEQGITVLEAQRAVLGDAAVDAAVSGMRHKLEALRAKSPERHRKLVTVLFADVSGFTHLSESMDAEDVTEMMNSVWQRLDAAILNTGGKIDKHIGDAVMALWGVDSASEDDPQHAITAALAMQAALKELIASHAASGSQRGSAVAAIKIRIGVNTGHVLIGEVGTSREFSALGDTVTTANRIEQAASVGSVLISLDTYRHVRGVFDVSEQEPITIPGRAEPLVVYEVQAAKPRAFRIGKRGVEGVETRMVGRESDLANIKAIFEVVVRNQSARIVTIAGDAGVGKSRLVHEWRKWLELLPDQVWFFSGRADQLLSHTPFGLIRDVIANRLQIQDSDAADAARAKLIAGVERVLDHDTEQKAHIIGNLIGLDFPNSPHVKKLMSDSGLIRSRAFEYVAELIHGFNRRDLSPICIVLEDFHWADDGSIDLVGDLLRRSADTPILIICLTRPALYENHPEWGRNSAHHLTIQLDPLTKDESRSLVNEILQKVDAVPDVLRELVITRAEGNPYYVEELVKMLIEDGVIVKSEPKWSIEADKLVALRIPPTLTGVLQARMDSLPPDEKSILQRAAVVGKIFWDTALQELSEGASSTELELALERLIGRELIFEREDSAFAGSHEYTFKHTILHEVAYESLLKRQRRTYHSRIAQWLVQQSGERAAEYVGLIADHYERAGDVGKALEYLNQAGRQAMVISSYKDAITYFERGLALATGPSANELLNSQQWEASLKLHLGRSYQGLGELNVSRELLEESLNVAREIKDKGGTARALTWLGNCELNLGDYDKAMAHQQESIELSRAYDDMPVLASALISLGELTYRASRYEEAITYLEEGLSLARELDDKWRQAMGLHSLAFVYWGRGEYTSATQHFNQSLQLFKEIADRRGMADALNGLGAAAYMMGDHKMARDYYQESLDHAREIGPLAVGVARALINLGEVAYDMGDYDDAASFQTEALKLSVETSATPRIVYLIYSMARLRDHAGDKVTALEWLSLARTHPARASDVLESSQQYFEELQRQMPLDEAKAAVERGKKLRLDDVVAEILGETISA